MLPIFAAIILVYILTKIEKELHVLANRRLRSNTPLDDRKGGLPVIMAYVDDVNCLLPLKDSGFFLEKFNEYGRKFGAIMNSEKKLGS